MKDRELYYIYIGGGAVLLLIAGLYGAISTVTHIFSFLLISGLILAIFIVAFIELIIVERLIDQLAEVVRHSKIVLYIIVVLGLAGLIFILASTLLFVSSLDQDFASCRQVLATFSDAIYNAERLTQCQLTEPLAAIVPENNRQINAATRQLPLVIASYLDFFADEASLSLTSVLTLGTMSSMITLLVLTIRISSFVLLKVLFTNYGSLSALKTTAPKAEAAYRAGNARYKKGDYRGAFAAFRTAIEQHPDERRYLSSLWRFGCLWENAPEIIEVCDSLIDVLPLELEGPIVDTRGTARALTGDYERAVQDFTTFIVWARQRGVPAPHLARRRQWIKSLEQGCNPFSEANLRELLGD